jgi:O-antigen/teichoic acid export membrane protein
VNDPAETSPDEGKPAHDVTGRDRLVSNVLFSWGAHFVFIIAGFIMPRMIDRRLGQDLLGVWDFAWSLVSYFSLVQMGISSSVNRYVARYHAVGDTAAVNGVVSSASCLLGIAGLLVVGLTISVSVLVPRLFGPRLGENIPQAQWVVFFLGLALACEIAFSAFSGVLTGCHRWGFHNGIKSGWHVVSVTGMMIALVLGGNLSNLAEVYFVGQMAVSLTRILLAHRVCADLHVRLSFVRRSTIKNVFAFGGKTLIPSLSNLLLNQTTSILIIVYLGPAALALYSRPRSLIRHMNTLVSKMAFVLTPTASSLQSTGDIAEIRNLVIKSVRYSCYMALPMVLLLVGFGGPIVGFWMGPAYANDWVPAILAVGYLAMMLNLPLMSILAGLNAHGRAGMAQFVGSMCSVALTVLVLGYLKWGLVGAAIAVTLPLTIVNAVYIPFLICRRVGLDVGRYALSVLAGPALRILPFAICLVIARVLFHTRPLIGLALGGGVGGVSLGVLYWRNVLPDQMKTRLCRFRAAAAQAKMVPGSLDG